MTGLTDGLTHHCPTETVKNRYFQFGNCIAFVMYYFVMFCFVLLFVRHHLRNNFQNSIRKGMAKFAIK